jgi:hypothetical protein
LPFAQDKTIIPALFMKNGVKTANDNIYFAEDVLKLLRK